VQELSFNRQPGPAPVGAWRLRRLSLSAGWVLAARRGGATSARQSTPPASNGRRSGRGTGWLVRCGCPVTSNAQGPTQRAGGSPHDCGQMASGLAAIEIISWGLVGFT